MQKRTIAIVEARMSSTRLPGKVLMPAAGKALLEHLVERLSRAKSLDEIVVATPSNHVDDPVVELAERLDVGCFRGSEDDVLSRVLGAAQAFRADVIAEITGDCPLIDPAIVELCVKRYFDAGVDYVSNVLEPSYPTGMATQVFSANTLKDVDRLTHDPSDREHVSLYIYSHPEKYKLLNLSAPPQHTRPKVRLTLDTAEDYRVIKAIFQALYPVNRGFGLDDILAFLDAHPEIAAINADVQQKPARP
jgi:spore coat polysaccharide biosynthesis protein SpsF